REVRHPPNACRHQRATTASASRTETEAGESMAVQLSDTLDAEKAVLGALLHDPSKTRAMAGTVAPGDFSSPVLGGLYSLMVGKAASGQPVDPVTLWPAIQADPQLSRSIKSAAMLHD